MTTEQFESLGISKELAQKAAEQSQEELKGYVPKHKFDEVSAENKTLKEAAKENETALEELKKNTGDAEALKAQIQQMQDAQKESETRHQEELKDIRLTNAIKLSIAGKVHDEDLVSGLFDKGKLILSENGKVTGLDEQLKSLQETKKFLFKEEEPQPKPGFIKIGATPPQNQNSGEQHVTLKDAIASHYQQAK